MQATQTTLDVSTIVQIVTWFIGALQVAGMAILAFLFGQIREAKAAAKAGDVEVLKALERVEDNAKAGDVAVMGAVEKALRQFEDTIREQRERLDHARETMLSKADWREDLKEIYAKLDRNAHASESSRTAVLDRLSEMAVSAARVQEQAGSVAQQMQNFVETQAELTTSVTEMRSEMRRHFPIVPLVPVPPGGGL